MKAQKISYSEDVDILMIQLSDKKVDDAYDTDNMIVHIDEKGEPVLLEIFHGSKFLKNLGNAIPQKMKQEIFRPSSTFVAHKIK